MQNRDEPNSKPEDYCMSESFLQKKNDLSNGIYNKCSTSIHPKPAGSYEVWTKLQLAEASNLQTITIMVPMQENWP